MTGTARRFDWPLLGGLLLVLIAVKAGLTYLAGVELHYDEAQYWEWSQQLDLGYYSKGPLIAWLIAAAELLFGHGEWQIRLPAWLGHGIFLILIYAFAHDVWRTRAAAWWALVLALCSPLYFTLGLVMTTDVWLFLFWTWGLWAVYRALYRQQNLAWYEAGLAIGIGALTKLSIGLLPALAGLAVLLTPSLRQHLTRPHLWGGLVLMLVCMSPMIYWNAQHDWVMFRHELGHVEIKTWSLLRGLRFLAEQILALSPLLVLVAATVLWRVPRAADQRFLWLLSLGWIAFFFFKALSAKVQLNWPAPCYIGLLVLFAGHIPALTRFKRGVVIAGLALSAVVMLLAYFPYVIGLKGTQDPFKEAKGWREPIARISKSAPPADFILTPNYKITAQAAFYWPVRINTYVAGDSERRYNQHDLWPGIEREAGRDGLWISTSPAYPALLDTAFVSCTRLDPVPAITRDGSVMRVFYPMHCTNYRPVAWPQPSHY